MHNMQIYKLLDQLINQILNFNRMKRKSCVSCVVLEWITFFKKKNAQRLNYMWSVSTEQWVVGNEYNNKSKYLTANFLFILCTQLGPICEWNGQNERSETLAMCDTWPLLFDGMDDTAKMVSSATIEWMNWKKCEIKSRCLSSIHSVNCVNNSHLKSFNFNRLIEILQWDSFER